MASYKYLIFFALACLTVYVSAVEQTSESSENGARVKKHAYIAAAPAPVLAYSAVAPAYSYAYSSYPYKYPTYPTAYSTSSFTTYPKYAAYPKYVAYPKYAAYPKYPTVYAQDDGQYWPGKYEKTYYPAPVYKSGYPVYHY